MVPTGLRIAGGRDDREEGNNSGKLAAMTKDRHQNLSPVNGWMVEVKQGELEGTAPRPEPADRVP